MWTENRWWLWCGVIFLHIISGFEWTNVIHLCRIFKVASLHNNTTANNPILCELRISWDVYLLIISQLQMLYIWNFLVKIVFILHHVNLESPTYAQISDTVPYNEDPLYVIPNFIDDVTKPSLKLGHVWVITSLCSMRMLLFIHVLI